MVKASPALKWCKQDAQADGQLYRFNYVATIMRNNH